MCIMAQLRHSQTLCSDTNFVMTHKYSLEDRASLCRHTGNETSKSLI